MLFLTITSGRDDYSSNSEIYFPTIRNLDFLTESTNLIYLDLGSSGSVTDFSPIYNLTNLEYLSYSIGLQTEISQITSLTNLKELELYQSNLTDFSPIGTLTNLETLRIRSFINGQSLSNLLWLNSLKNLKYFDIYSDSCKNLTLTNLTKLDSLPYNLSSFRNLDTLIFSGLSSLKAIEPSYSNYKFSVFSITNMATLRYMNLRVEFDSMISFTLDTLPALEYFRLETDSVSNLEYISTLTSLDTLILKGYSGNDTVALASISKLIDLKYLSIYYSYNSNSIFSGINSLVSLTKLNHLELVGLSDLSLIINSTELEYLKIDTLQTDSLSQLSNFSELKHLEIDLGNQSDLSVFSNMSQLTSLTVSGIDTSADLSPIVNCMDYGDSLYFSIYPKSIIPESIVDSLYAKGVWLR